MSDDFVSLERLTIAYGDAVAVESLDLGIRRGELLALLGPSGCGKTTTMRTVAGLIAPKSGAIRIDGVDVTRTPANRRNVGLVFQSYALFPHLSAFENVAFGLRLKRLPAGEIRTRARAGLATVNLEEFAGRNPSALSGGQQQRLALARALVMQPKVLLLDEPLSNLDARLRLDMRMELQGVQRETGVTMVFVTHDQSEALALADRVALMRDGRLEQLGPPEALYDRPATRFAADFMGFENIFDCEDGALVGNRGRIPLIGAPPGRTVLAWRPGAVTLGRGPQRGVVRGVSFGGETREYVLETAFGAIKARTAADAPALAIGEQASFDLEVARARVIPEVE